jgi:glycosyltransferase involved in cell wall biosynthesis
MNNLSTDSNPLISVVIPTYNRAKYLDRCLQSIVSNEHNYFEVVVSDNASPDNTQEIIDKYLTDSRVHYYRNEKNLGARENIYKATKYAQGRYIFWLTDDDYLLPDALSKVVDVIKSNPKIGYIYSPFAVLDDRNGEIVWRHDNFPQDILLESGLETIAQVLPATWVFSRQVLKKDLIDWMAWEKYKENSYYMTILAGRILLKASAYYIASDLIVHTWYNPIYWEEFGQTHLDIQLFNQISTRNCMKSVFFDQKPNQKTRKIINNWENDSFKNFLINSDSGFDYLLKARGLKEAIKWLIMEYNITGSMIVTWLSFMLKNYLIRKIKLKLKKVIFGNFQTNK